MPLVSDYLAARLLAIGPSSIVPVGPIIPGLLELDELGLLLGATVGVLTLLLVLCSPATGQAGRYTVLSIFFLLVALATLSAANVIVFYVGWELAALFAWGLGQLAGDADGESAAPFNAAGALASLLMFGGLLLLATESRTTSLAGLKLAEGGLVTLLVLGAIFLKAFGVLSEMSQPTTPGQFSLASAALAGASLLIVGFYPVLRLLGPASARSPEWQEPAVALAGGLAILAALAALGQQDLRRALSYGALSQFSAFAFALAAGPQQATLGALYGAVAYALAATGLLLCAALVEAATGQRDLQRIGGVAQRLPAVAVLFVVCVVAMAGLPPFGGFVASGLVGLALWQQAGPAEAVTWLALSLLTVLYLVRLFARVFLGELRGPVKADAHWTVLAAVTAIAAGLALAGVAPDQVMALVRPAFALLTG